jgi:hypothetical protein
LRRNRLDNQIKYQWRVTKYNPDLGMKRGTIHYQRWTCPSEIGKIISGKEFTLNEYLQVETAYVNTVINFIEDSGINSLRILQLSKRDISEEDKASALFDKEFDKLVLKEDLLVNKHEISLICKMVLRNFLDCQLHLKDNFFVHFGWDYYMFIGSSVNCLSVIDLAQNYGLFVEEFQSPYYFSEEETTRLVQWNEIGAEPKVVVDVEELLGIPLQEYRRIFNLSEEHPVIGWFEILEGQRDFFQRYLNHKMDFNKYEYGFCGGH